MVFPTYMNASGEEQKLEFSRPFDVRCSTFFACTPRGSMVKLAFSPYGYQVHEALHAAGYAPALLGYSHKPAIGADAVVMEYLPPPSGNENGWTTLFDLSVANAALVHNKKELILEKLKAILLVLKNSNLVHGDLRSNNLMVYGTRFNIVEPVQLKAIDMEWAGKQGEVCYPDNRNSQVGYPGEAGKYIGLGDDAQMVEMWAALV